MRSKAKPFVPTQEDWAEMHRLNILTMPSDEEIEKEIEKENERQKDIEYFFQYQCQQLEEEFWRDHDQRAA